MNKHRSLREISRVLSVQAECILLAYQRIYPSREQLIRTDILGELSTGRVLDFLGLLLPHDTQNVSVDQVEGGTELEHYLISAHIKQLGELCATSWAISEVFVISVHRLLER